MTVTDPTIRTGTAPADPHPPHPADPVEPNFVVPGPAAGEAAPQPAAEERSDRGAGWAGSWWAELTWPGFLLLLLAAMLLLAAVTTADLFLIKSSVNRIVRDSELVSWLTAAGLALAGVALMIHAGHRARIRHATGEGSAAHHLVPILGWVVLGIGMFLLRYNAAGLVTTGAAYEGDAAAVEDPEAREHLLAWVLASVHLATGILAFLDGWALTNPVATTLRNIRWVLPSVARRRGQLEGLADRQATHLDAAVRDLTAAERDAEASKATWAALAAELKELARLRLAEHLRDPRATSGVHSPTG